MAAYALAARMGCSVEVIDRMTASEFAHWQAFYRLRERERGR